MLKTINSFEFPKVLKKIVIEKSELKNAGILGAAALFSTNVT